MSSGMNRTQAEEYAKTMTYKQAISNIRTGKGIMYRKASLIKLRELAEIADKLERDNDMTKEEAIDRLMWLKDVPHINDDKWIEAIDMAIEAQQTEVAQTDLIQRSDVLEVISDAQDGSGSTYNILQPIFVKVNNLPSCHRCYECDEQFYQQLLEKGMIELPQEYVAVVRCKDCKWAEKAILDEYCVECTMYHTSCMKHGYCHHGERREP